ncbi:MAG: tRNA (adenosine(37)-N6)-threonylcarbamoyltransferase complex transferase subunit TsaD [Candidatus Omnitrophota bacterium]
MYTLGIETSCDETSVSITDGRKILSNVVTSSVHLHSEFGGVVPEIASRFHLEYITPIIRESLKEAGLSLDRIELIAVTKEPGLIGSLLVGISMARALSFSLSIPLIEVNHIIAHIYANLMHYDGLDFPLMGLIVSGGHTLIIWMDDIDKWKVIGQTQDDAAGEAYDKVAKILGLGYPGGPIIEKRAALGNKFKIRFPRSKIKRGVFDYSFSGIKTAVLYYIQKRGGAKLPDEMINAICAGFQDAVCDMLIEKVMLAARKNRADKIVVGGGVSANMALRDRISAESKKWGIDIYFPPMKLCLDNAAMVGGLGEALYRKRQS